MSTVDELFTEWLNENGAEIISNNVDIKDTVSDFVSSDTNLYDKIVEMLKEEVDGGTFNEDIIEGIKDAVILSLEERLDAANQRIEKLEQIEELTNKRLKVLADAIFSMSRDIDKISSRGWFKWLGF